jgi:hypothetical protein
MVDEYRGYLAEESFVLTGNVFPFPFALLVYRSATPIERTKVDELARARVVAQEGDPEYGRILMRERIKAVEELMEVPHREDWMAFMYPTNGITQPFAARALNEEAGWALILRAMGELRAAGGDLFLHCERGH